MAAGIPTRAALADALGTSYTQVRRWELGENEAAASVVISLSRLLRVSTDWILTGNGWGPDLALDGSGEHPLDSDGQTGTDGR
jgi:transcriptional regulator with XRE-family HTH domain